MIKAIISNKDGGAGNVLNPKLVSFCGWFSLLATLVSLISIWSHLKSYTRPAFVIYCFFSLLLNYLGGERAIIVMLHEREPTKHLWPVGDPYSFLSLKRGILQYVYIKPIIASVTMVLKYKDLYNDGDFSLRSGYLWITLIYNLSVCWTLYCLAIFFQATKLDLVNYRPFAKFVCVKAVVFLTFWQSIVVSFLVGFNIFSLGKNIPPEETSVAIQDSLICFEMLIASIAHLYSFTRMDYRYKKQSPALVRLKLYCAIKDSIGFKDIILDSKDTINGSQFNYRAFEPVEGLSFTSAGRKNRMQEGLRYSKVEQKKYWLNTNNTPISPSVTSPLSLSHSNNFFSGSPTSGTMNDLTKVEFDDVHTDKEMESLYKSSKAFSYGDYNIPTIEGDWKAFYYRKKEKDNLNPLTTSSNADLLNSSQRPTSNYSSFHNFSNHSTTSPSSVTLNINSTNKPSMLQSVLKTTQAPIQNQSAESLDQDNSIEINTNNASQNETSSHSFSSPWESSSFKKVNIKMPYDSHLPQDFAKDPWNE